MYRQEPSHQNHLSGRKNKLINVFQCGSRINLTAIEQTGAASSDGNLRKQFAMPDESPITTEHRETETSSTCETSSTYWTQKLERGQPMAQLSIQPVQLTYKAWQGLKL